MGKPSRIPSVSRPYVCKMCGRAMGAPSPHRCIGGYRKRHLEFTDIRHIIETIDNETLQTN